MSGQPEPEELLRAAARHVDRDAMVRVIEAIAELARRHAPAAMPGHQAIVHAAERAATAEAEIPSMLRSRVSCATEMEVCLGAAEWALEEAETMLTDALTDLGAAFVPEAGVEARDRVRDVVRATLAETISAVLYPPCPSPP